MTAPGRPGSFGSIFPAQIYDIDGDGCLEILCVMDKRFLILEGATGREGGACASVRRSP